MKLKKKMYSTVCLLNEKVVYKGLVLADSENEAVSILQEILPSMRSELSRIYLNGFTVPRYMMGQTQY